jgi:hypothetical protein
MHDGGPGGAHWQETTLGQKFVGYDHRGTFRMGTHANAGSMFLEETNHEDRDRDVFPTLPVLVLNGFTYPRPRIGQQGTGSLQYSSYLTPRDSYVWWEVTAT